MVFNGVSSPILLPSFLCCMFPHECFLKNANMTKCSYRAASKKIIPHSLWGILVVIFLVFPFLFFFPALSFFFFFPLTVWTLQYITFSFYWALSEKLWLKLCCFTWLHSAQQIIVFKLPSTELCSTQEMKGQLQIWCG